MWKVVCYSIRKSKMYLYACVLIDARLMEDIEIRRRNEMEQRTQTFMISTAAYCVASYVLGNLLILC